MHILQDYVERLPSLLPAGDLLLPKLGEEAENAMRVPDGSSKYSVLSMIS